MCDNIVGCKNNKIAYLYHSNQLTLIMENRIMKIFRLVIMALAFVVLTVFMVLHVRAGIETQMSKLYLGLYVVLMGWAAVRVFSIAKDLFQK